MKTVKLYELHELSNDARENAYNEWVESVGLYDVEDQLETGLDYEIRKTIEPIIKEWDCDSYGRMWPIMRRVNIPQNGRAPRMMDTGYCESLDICEAFNQYGPKMQEYAAMWYAVAYPEDGSPFYNCDDQTSYDLLGMYEALYLKEYEKAAQTVLNMWQEKRDSEREFLTSFEAFEDESNQGDEWRRRDKSGRVYYYDSRNWYNADGEFYGRSNVNGECVSLVCVS